MLNPLGKQRTFLFQPLCFQGFSLFNNIFAHIRAERLRNPNAAVFIQVVFKESNQHPRWCYNCVIQSMRKVVRALFRLNTNAEAARLRVPEIGAAPHLKIFLLAGRPGLYVNALDLEVGKVARAALQRADRDIERTEEINRIMVKLFKLGRAVLRLADNNHFLLFKLVDPVDAALLNPMGADLFSETRRIAGQSLGEFLLRQDRVDKFTDH